MRTTVTIDGELLRAAKVLAAKEDRSMSSVRERPCAPSSSNPGQRGAAPGNLRPPGLRGKLTVDPNDDAGLRDAMERP